MYVYVRNTYIYIYTEIHDLSLSLFVPLSIYTYMYICTCVYEKIYDILQTAYTCMEDDGYMCLYI